MNGFTKEELNILYTFIANIDWSDYEKIEDMFNIKNKLNQIHNKIKSMIYNYPAEEQQQQKRIDTACKEVFLENHKEFLDKTAFREIIKNDDIGK